MRSLQILGISSLALLLTACAQNSSEDNYVIEQTYVHKYGVAVPSDFWTASGEHGSVVSTMNNGVVVTHSYNSGLLEGDTTYSYAHSSQIQKSETYSQGTLVKETEYYFEGSPKSQIAYDSPLGMRTVSSWYLSGTPRSIEQYAGDQLVNGQYYTSNNQIDSRVENSAGTRLLRDDHGLLLATDTIADGQNSFRTTYHANGSPNEQITFKNGLKDGTIKSCFPGGEPASVETWCAGQQTGITTLYQHGEKFAEVPYVNGVKQGVEKRYRDGNVLVLEISWNNDLQNGPMKTYVGDSYTTAWYYKGMPTTKTDYEFLMNKPTK